MVSHLASRRTRAPWWAAGDDDWKASWSAIPDYCKAKLEVDEYLTAMAEKRMRKEKEMGVESGRGNGAFQAIVLRPGLLSDEKATGRVELGKTAGAKGNVSREEVAVVADKLLAREDTRGYWDLLAGEEPVDEAVERVVREKIDAIEGEDVDAIRKRFKGEKLEIRT